LAADEFIMSAEFSGALRERVTLEQRLDNRDGLAGAKWKYAYDGAAWSSVIPLIPAGLVAGDSLSALPRWQVIMRKREGVDQRTRLSWRRKYLMVRLVVSDPRDPSRMVLTCDEVR
jgi:head-tail adaptor